MLVQVMRSVSSKLGFRSNFYRCETSSSASGPRIMKVTVCGANGAVGQPLSLMLKQSPVIEELALYSRNSTLGLAADISHLDTKCKVKSYSGLKETGDALKDARIVMITAGVSMKPGMSREDMFQDNAEIVKGLMEACTKHCPAALIGIVTNPVNSLVPVACEVFKQAGLDSESRIFGITSLDSIRANTFVSEVSGLKPEDVVVPVIGGHSHKTMVPLFSQASPSMEVTEDQIQQLTVSVQNAGKEVTKANEGVRSASLSTAFACARFVIALVKGLLGEELVECAYVRSNVTKELEYLATPLVLGPQGIVRNLGLPKMSEYETGLFQRAIPHLREDIQKGIVFMRGEKSEDLQQRPDDKKTAVKEAKADCPMP